MTGETRRGGPSALVRVAWLAASTLALAGAALLAADLGRWTARPSSPGGGSYTPPERSLPSLREATATPVSADRPPKATDDGSSTGIRVLLIAVAILALLLIGRWLFHRIREAQLRRTEGNLTAPALSLTPAQPPPLAPEAAGREFDPRAAADAIISCWVWLEDFQADQGRARLPHETPTEYLQRIESGAELSPSATTLLALYQRARFDHVALSEDAALQARDAVGRLCSREEPATPVGAEDGR